MGTASKSTRKDPYVGYDAPAVARAAQVCAKCGEFPPCTVACVHAVDVPGLVSLAGRAACEALPLVRWFQERETVEAALITDMICDSYNG
jgi:NADPH-dependent glutamate synthase beta subunit-like oxidoreductase